MNSLHSHFPTVWSMILLVLGLSYGLVAYGYVMSLALFPGREKLELVERIILSIGLSLTVQPLIIYALHTSIQLSPNAQNIVLVDVLVSFISICVYAIRKPHYSKNNS